MPSRAAVWFLYLHLYLLPLYRCIPSQQYTALHALYISTSGDEWDEYCNINWNFTDGSDPCIDQWGGVDCGYDAVTCQSINCTVTSLRLSNCNLTGYLPDDIGDIDTLSGLYIDSNEITGTIPSSLTKLTQLYILDFSSTLLSGYIPPLPSSLFSVNLQKNYLSGPIPSYLLDISFLVTLDLRYNMLTGTIPSSFSFLPNIVSLTLNSNCLTGPVLSPLPQQLQVIDVSDNMLSGLLPTHWCSGECQVYSIGVGGNYIHGDIPSSLGDLSKLSTLNISRNSLSSSIPSTISAYTRLRDVDFSSNYLTGVLDTIVGMSSLSQLSLSNNLLSGPVRYLCISSTLAHLTLNDNYLTGSLSFNCSPPAKRLFVLDVSNNLLSGSLPTVYSGTPNIMQLHLKSNFFTSTIPPGLCNLPYLLLLDLGTNEITGSLPASLFEGNMQYLYIHDNDIVGPIPSNIGDAQYLQQLSAFNNDLTGPLPLSLRNCSYLQTILVKNNRLTGHLNDVFTSSGDSVFTLLQAIDISQNRFSGAFPDAVFSLVNIRYIAATGGCFHGSIPSSVCESSTLETLVLEGLHSGRECRRPIWNPFALKPAYISSSKGSTIPTCIWELPNLKTLHLTGNLLEGTIPDPPNIFSLSDLSLAYNTLEGSIPLSLRKSPLRKLDLSHNRLSGTCDDLNAEGYISAQQSQQSVKLSLSVNRLSGHVPKNVKRISHINLLAGNMFDCRDTNQLPSRDPQSSTYSCGSDRVDYSLLLFISLCVVVCTTFGIILAFRGNQIFRVIIQLISDLRKWHNVASNVNPSINPELSNFLRSLREMRVLVINMSVMIVITFMIVYIILKTALGAGTHTYQYRYLFSAAFLVGSTSAYVLLCLVVFSMVVLLGFVMHSDTKYCDSNKEISQGEEDIATTSASNGKASSYLRSYIYIIAVASINCVVVLGVKGSYVYILIWEDVSQVAAGFMQVALSLFDIVFNSMVLTKGISLFPRLLRSKVRIRLHLILMMFNSIVAPILASAMTDQSCFVDLFTGTADISTGGTYELCNTINNDLKCVSYYSVSLSTSFTPPYTYSYQCSSAVLRNFIPVFILTYTLIAFLQPVLAALIIQFTNIQKWNVTITLIPSILWPNRQHKHEYRKVLGAGVIMSNILHHCSVLMTYGIASPLCCIVIANSVCVTTHMWHIIIGRYLHLRSKRSRSEAAKDTVCMFDSSGVVPCGLPYTGATEYGKVLESACHGVCRGPMKAVWSTVDLMAAFFALLFADIAGDQVGGARALLRASLPMVCVPLLLRVVFRSTRGKLFIIEIFRRWENSKWLKSVEGRLASSADRWSRHWTMNPINTNTDGTESSVL